MTADVELLPLPQWTQYNAHLRISANSLQKRVQDYARANVEQHTAAQAAEIEALRAEVERWKREHLAELTEVGEQSEARSHAEAHAERLAEALRVAMQALIPLHNAHMPDERAGLTDEDVAAAEAAFEQGRAALEQENDRG